jgi:hypothetical protein
MNLMEGVESCDGFDAREIPVVSSTPPAKQAASTRKSTAFPARTILQSGLVFFPEVFGGGGVIAGMVISPS